MYKMLYLRSTESRRGKRRKREGTELPDAGLFSACSWLNAQRPIVQLQNARGMDESEMMMMGDAHPCRTP